MSTGDESRFLRHGELGHGATAAVYLADDHERGHVVALKVLHPHLVGDASARRRLQREVRAAALVQHEAALVPYALHELPEGTALSMPFHPGETLSARVAARGPLRPAEVRILGTRLASALVVAHRAGVLHRDLSPGNVLLSEADDAVLTDFGLARVGEAHTATATGMLGTVGYAAPELLDGQRGDPRSDLFALGAVLYLALTGSPPFPGDSAVAALKAQLAGRVRPVREVVPGCPKDLARTVEALLEADPDRRPQGAPDVLDLLEGRIPTAPPPGRAAEPVPVVPEGRWRVQVRERDADRGRREQLRQAAEQTPAQRPWGEIGDAIGRSIRDGLRAMVGLSLEAPEPPEERLARTLRALGFEPDERRLLEPTFLLVKGVDEATARSLAAEADGLGFDASATSAPAQISQREWMAAAGLLILATMLFVFTQVDGWIFIGALLVLPSARLFQGEATEDEPEAVASRAVEVVPEGPRSADVGDRALLALDALLEVLADTELPEVAARDLRATHDELRALAVVTARVLRSGAPVATGLDAEVAQLERRRARLLALRSAGHGDDGEELRSVESALEARRQALLAADRAEGERVAAMAQLVEIASTADRVRYELVAGPRADVGGATDRLRREARALQDARAELARQRSAG